MKTPLIRYHGGKFRLADWIIGFFPDNHVVYLELFGGAGSVLFRKQRSFQEVYNDLDGDICNLFRVLRDPARAPKLIEQLELTPYSRDEFRAAYEPSDDPIEQARRLVIRAQMGFGSAGATKAHTGFRTDCRRKHGTSASLWRHFPRSLAKFTERLQGVMIENRPAVRLIETHDGTDALFYVDPPYLHETRAMRPGRDYYRHEMSDADHEELLGWLLKADGFVVLSGYDNDMYNDLLAGWSKYEKQARISSGRGTSIRTECLWINPQTQLQMKQQRLAL